MQGKHTQAFQPRVVGGTSKPNIKAFIAVYSASNSPRYLHRRQALRGTWFPNSTDIQRWQQDSGIIVRFILGKSSNDTQNVLIQREASKYADMLVLPLVETYEQLSTKTLALLKHVHASYYADWVIRMDDDAYLTSPERLLHAIQQWESKGGDYVGCMNKGQPAFNETYSFSPYYEPRYKLFATCGQENVYNAYAWTGSLMALSRKAVDIGIVQRLDHLRPFANDDVAMGAWLLGVNVTFVEDRRLCEHACSSTTVAVTFHTQYTDADKTASPALALHTSQACRYIRAQPRLSTDTSMIL
eukprot:jgi/Chrzof1/12662/Cz07g02230.t1